MCNLVIIGGGWSGCAAAIAAKKAGAEVTLLERTDMLLGLGNVGGIMRNNGRFTAAEENIVLGAAELFEVTDSCARHINVCFPGHEHASLYDVTKVEPEVRRLLSKIGVNIKLKTRVTDVIMKECKDRQKRVIDGLVAADGRELKGDVFVETTGSTGGPGNCLTYGNGCCMCILRCPAFGPRVSISEKAGGEDIMGMRKDGSYGAFSGSGKLEKQSLSQEIQQQLNEKGVAVIKLPKNAVKKEKLDLKVCRQYALDEYAENIILLDTGYAKLMTPYFELGALRQIPGFENARYVDPYAGGNGNSIRYLSVARRDNTMRVSGVENLFCGGEKSGLFVGHTEAISTGSLAGHNAVRYCAGIKPLVLPVATAIGDLISFANSNLDNEEKLKTRYTFAGAEYFERMKKKGLYTTDKEAIRKRIKKYNLENIYNEKIISPIA